MKITATVLLEAGNVTKPVTAHTCVKAWMAFTKQRENFRAENRCMAPEC